MGLQIVVVFDWKRKQCYRIFVVFGKTGKELEINAVVFEKNGVGYKIVVNFEESRMLKFGFNFQILSNIWYRKFKKEIRLHVVCEKRKSRVLKFGLKFLKGSDLCYRKFKKHQPRV